MTRHKRDFTIRSCAEAKALRLKQYYTGSPCKHGHDAPRSTTNGTCMECVSVRHKQWRQRPEAKEIVASAGAAYQKRNPNYARDRYRKDPQKSIAASLAYQQASPERARERRAKWKRVNPHLVAADTAKRRAAKRMATPKWLTVEHLKEIENMYLDAATKPGGPWHVDHIYPLISNVVCGLHVPWNLRVISAKDNWSKNNRLPAGGI